MTNIKWRKSTRSADNGGECVELAVLPGIVAVRDSKNPNGPKLAFSRSAMRGFVAGVKSHQ